MVSGTASTWRTAAAPTPCRRSVSRLVAPVDLVEHVGRQRVVGDDLVVGYAEQPEQQGREHAGPVLAGHAEVDRRQRRPARRGSRSASAYDGAPVLEHDEVDLGRGARRREVDVWGACIARSMVARCTWRTSRSPSAPMPIRSSSSWARKSMAVTMPISASRGPSDSVEPVQRVAPVEPPPSHVASVGGRVPAEVTEVDRTAARGSSRPPPGDDGPGPAPCASACCSKRDCSTRMKMPSASAQSRSPAWIVPLVCTLRPSIRVVAAAKSSA